MEDTTTQGLSFSVKLGLAIAFLVILIAAFTIVQTMSSKKTNQLSTMATDADQSTYTSLDGHEVTGVQVQSYAKTWDTGDVYVVVKRASSSEIVLYYDKDLTKPIDSKTNREICAGISNKHSAYYINPNAKFTVEVNYDDDDSLAGVTFTQNQ